MLLSAGRWVNAYLVVCACDLCHLFVQVVKGLRGGVQDVALKMLLGDTHYHVHSFRQASYTLSSISMLYASCTHAIQQRSTSLDHLSQCGAKMQNGLATYCTAVCINPGG